MTHTVYVVTDADHAISTLSHLGTVEASESERASWRSASEFQPKPGRGISAVWRVEVVEDDATDPTQSALYWHALNRRAIAAVLNVAVGVYTASTVTQLYPRPRNEEERLEAARSQLRADYWNDVRGVVDDVKLDIERRNLTTEDEVSEYIDQACDGHSRVIYTGQAIECLLFTRNDEAYEEYGDLDSLGADNTGEMYTKLAYYAFRADVSDELGDVAALLEEAEPTKCDACGDEIADGDEALETGDGVYHTTCDPDAAEQV